MKKISTLAIAFTYVSLIKAMTLKPLFFFVLFFNEAIQLNPLPCLPGRGIWVAAFLPAVHSDVLFLKPCSPVHLLCSSLLFLLKALHSAAFKGLVISHSAPLSMPEIKCSNS